MNRAPDPFPIFERTGTPDNMNELDANIEKVADQLIMELDRIQHLPSKPNAQTLKLEDLRFLSYALVVHRSRRGKVLTEHHLRLLHAVLGIRRIPERAAEKVGLPPVKKVREFMKAADLLAKDPDISVKALARAVGVAPKTIRD